MTVKLAPRFVSKGRANPWSSPPPRRFRAMRPTMLEPEELTDWPLFPKMIVSIGLVGAVWLIVTGGM